MKKNKKVRKSKKVSRSNRNEIVIKVQSIAPQIIKESALLPEKEGGKYRVVKSWLSDKQVLRMIQTTPKEVIFNRKGRGGKDFDYVPGWYFKKALNFSFGWNWDFYIISKEIIGAIGSQGTQVVSLGRLVAKDDEGHTITKEDFGKAEIKYLKGTKVPVDIGNDYKTSATDALKRCCVQLGICSDVYGKSELISEVNVEIEQDISSSEKILSTKRIEAPKTKMGELFDCYGFTKAGCPKGNSITKRQYDFTMSVCKKPLCKYCFDEFNKR